MAGNIAAPLKGQEYQWLYGWLRCLDFIGPKRPIDVVHVENPAAGFFDDVTITPASDSVWPAQFVQVKFHVRQDGAFSFEDYASTENVKGGLLYKAWTSWQWLRDEHPTAEILLVSPWQWSTDDPVIPDNSRWPTDFINGSVTGAKLDARQSWSSVLGDPDEAEFSAFLSAMRFRLGHDDLSDLEDRCLNQMRVCGLRSDKDALTKARTEIRERVMERDARITSDVMEGIIEELDLREGEPEPSVTLVVHTIRRQNWATGATDMGGEYELDWRDVFEGPEDQRGHDLIDDNDWNERLLPELREKASEIEDNETARLLRVRGLARLTAWFAVGYRFCDTAGWTIETDQRGARWRTDEPPASWRAEAAEQVLDGDEGVLALGIAVTGDPTAAAANYLATAGDPAGRLATIAVPEPGREAISSGSDLVRLANDIKAFIQRPVPRPRRVLLFYWGPKSGAVFIGHQLNATAREIQLFEEDGGLYKPSITLASGGSSTTEQAPHRSVDRDHGRRGPRAADGQQTRSRASPSRLDRGPPLQLGWSPR